MGTRSIYDNVLINRTVDALSVNGFYFVGNFIYNIVLYKTPTKYSHSRQNAIHVLFKIAHRSLIEFFTYT